MEEEEKRDPVRVCTSSRRWGRNKTAPALDSLQQQCVPDCLRYKLSLSTRYTSQHLPTRISSSSSSSRGLYSWVVGTGPGSVSPEFSVRVNWTIDMVELSRTTGTLVLMRRV
ncbi:hypothetical protein OUZ56_001811 [Daphnia magna]|uniref:Uncharacterized protein n=1 Tax=Daphnia magna TaxID=35525 RepID=A0ABR0A3T5_9CRUS|nr:hypothetical protein OUZ56_001811 [Daphnia magna]